MADNFGTLNPTTDSTKDDSYLVRQNGIDYKQSRDVLLSQVTDLWVGMVLPDSLQVTTRDLVFLADGSTYNRTDYPKLWSKIANSGVLVSQSLVDSAPETYAANYGDGDGVNTFTVPNYSLRPHLAMAGSHGAVGTTTEDRIQSMTGFINPILDQGSGQYLAVSPDRGGVFDNYSVGTAPALTKAYDETNKALGINFNASRVARTGATTEVNSSFLNFYIVHGEYA